MDTKQQRARRVMIAFAAIVLGAIAAFTVTMSMTTSYPSTPEPPSVARPPVHVDAPAPAAVAGAAVPPSTRDAVQEGSGNGATAASTATASATDVKGTRGSVLVDDGAAPRSPGNMGSLAKEDVKAGVAAVKDKVKDCYERALKVDAELAGSIKVAFTLEGNDEGKGVVTKGEVAESDMNSPFFEACVLKEIAGAEFKAPGGGGVVNVTYPFHFANDNDDADDADDADAAADAGP
jgi:hypothetical protein